MKIVISPAKSLNFEKQIPTPTFSEPQFLKQAATIQRTLKKKKPKALSQLMDISDKLAFILLMAMFIWVLILRRCR
jgi:cytoplasmic iron level regulating protein YaaA (DUF328/UPF0246 family)